MSERAEQLARERDVDGALVARAMDGDAAGFEALVRRHQEALFRHARGMGLDPDTAEDMVQETLVRGYSSLDRCRDPRRFRAWVFRILRNACLDHLKNVRRRDVPLDHPVAAGADAAAAAPTADLRHEIGNALARLSPILREAFLLRHEAGYSYDELADITDSSASAVKMRVHRARDELRALLAAPAPHDVTGTRTGSSL